MSGSPLTRDRWHRALVILIFKRWRQLVWTELEVHVLEAVEDYERLFCWRLLKFGSNGYIINLLFELLSNQISLLLELSLDRRKEYGVWLVLLLDRSHVVLMLHLVRDVRLLGVSW